jgi:hypothetical protein
MTPSVLIATAVVAWVVTMAAIVVILVKGAGFLARHAAGASPVNPALWWRFFFVGDFAPEAKPERRAILRLAIIPAIMVIAVAALMIVAAAPPSVPAR